MKLLFLIDCAGEDQPTLVAAAVIRILAHFDVARSVVGGWDWRFLRVKERTDGRAGKVQFQAASADVFERFCDEIAVHCGGSGAGGGLSFEGLRRIYHSLVESVSSYHWDSTATADVDIGPCHVFVVAPCPETLAELARSLKIKESSTRSQLSKKLAQAMFTPDLQKSFVVKHMALHWINVRQIDDLCQGSESQKGVGRDCIREALEGKFNGRLQSLRGLCHGSILGVPVNLQRLFGCDRKTASVGVGRFCPSSVEHPACCVLHLHPVFRQLVGGIQGARTVLDGTLRQRTTCDRATAGSHSVSVQLENAGKSETAPLQRQSTCLCVRGMIATHELVDLIPGDAKYYHTVGLCQASRGPKHPTDSGMPSAWFTAVLTELAEASAALVIDTVDPETAVPCTAVLRPIGPVSALLVTLGGAPLGLSLLSRMSDAGGQFITTAECICGRKGSDANSSNTCNCTRHRTPPVGAGLFPTRDSGAVTRAIEDGWILMASQSSVHTIPLLAALAAPPVTEVPSAVSKRCRKNVIDHMAVQVTVAQSRTRGRGTSRASSGTLSDVLLALLQCSDRPPSESLALPYLTSKGDASDTFARQITLALRTVFDLKRTLDEENVSRKEAKAIPTTVSPQEYVVRLLQLQVILRLHLLRLLSVSAIDATVSGYGFSPAVDSDCDKIALHDPPVLESDVVCLLDRLGPVMDLDSHSSTLTTFMTQVLVPTFLASIDKVLLRVCDHLEMADALPLYIRDIHLASDGGRSSPVAALRSSQGTSQPDSDEIPLEALAEPEPDEAAPPPRPRSTLGGALKALTSRQITVFAKPIKISRPKRSKRRKSKGSAKNSRRKGNKPNVVVAETPAKELAGKAASAQAIKRPRRDNVVQESPAVHKQKQAERERIDKLGDITARRSPRFRIPEAAVGTRELSVRRRTDMGDLPTVPLQFGSPRRSPRRHHAPVNDSDDDGKRGVKRALDL